MINTGPAQIQFYMKAMVGPWLLLSMRWEALEGLEHRWWLVGSYFKRLLSKERYREGMRKETSGRLLQ